MRDTQKVVFPELEKYSHYSVGWRGEKPYLNKAQILYEIEAMIAHELWKRNPDAPRGTVASCPPLHYSTEELLEISGVIEDVNLSEATNSIVTRKFPSDPSCAILSVAIER